MSMKIWPSLVVVFAANISSHQHVAVSSFSPPSSFSPLSFVVHPSSSSSPSSPLHKKCQQQPRSRSSCHYPSRIFSNTNDDEQLIKSLLNNDASSSASSASDNDPYSRYTHQIAIPLQDASELHSALHAIQTSLVRDCPRLIRACVMPALLRMPLLYVDGSSLEGGNVMGGSGNNDGKVDAILEQVVGRAIREVVYGEDGDVEMAEPILLPFRGLELQGEDNSVLYAVANNANAESVETKKERKEFSDFEDDDDGVITVDDWSTTTDAAKTKLGPSGWETLEKLVHTIQNELESNYGLTTCWPLDKPQGEEIDYEDEDPMIAAIKQRQRKWRPRVPFVRLPTDFYQDLQADLEKRNNSKNSANEEGGEEEEEPSVIDMGFDGISPLFWYEAWGEGQDDILPSPGVRMQSLAVYRRMVPGDGEAESSFYVPTSSSNDGPAQPWKNNGSVDDQKKSDNNSMELPVGDSKLRARERRETALAMDRLGEVEQRAEREWEEGKARWMEDLGDPSLNGNDDEDSFAQFDVGMEIGGEVTVEGDAAYSAPWSERDADENSIDISKKNEERSLPAEPIASIEIEQPKTRQKIDTKPRRELPSIEDNPIFQRMRKGQSQVTAKGQNTAVMLDGTPQDEEAPLPPYPSDPHFVGAWRVVSSPLGGTDFEDISELKASDNFILRVDGQVMGGPVLDVQYQHKAAGGEWKMFQATRRTTAKEGGGESEEDSSSVTQTRLRLRLLVPPEKERALVMEGEVTRLVMPGDAGDATTSSSSEGRMSYQDLLDGKSQNTIDEKFQPEAKGEGLLYCGGEAWMEDAEGGGNRRKLGPFSLMKLEAIDRKNLIYTVDVSRPKSEEDDEEDGEFK